MIWSDVISKKLLKKHNDMSDSQEEGEDMLIDPLRTDRLAHHKASLDFQVHIVQIRHSPEASALPVTVFKKLSIQWTTDLWTSDLTMLPINSRHILLIIGIWHFWLD